MKLYLIRHGDAVSAQVDPERPLSKKGRDETAAVAAFMKKSRVVVNEIWHSKKLRAKQTAEIVSEAIEFDEVLEINGLSPNDPVIDMLDEIYEAEEDLVIVGHLPFLAKLFAQLLINDEACEIVDFKASAAVCLNHNPDIGWEISWMVSPEILK